MEAKEKAKELVERYKVLTSAEYDFVNAAKQCALIAVDEIVKSQVLTRKLYERNDLINSDISEEPENFWQEVKQEINRL